MGAMSQLGFILPLPPLPNLPPLLLPASISPTIGTLIKELGRVPKWLRAMSHSPGLEERGINHLREEGWNFSLPSHLGSFRGTLLLGPPITLSRRLEFICTAPPPP